MATVMTPAMRRVADEAAAYTGEPSARLQKAAALIKGGKSAEDAMTAAGYGRSFVAGHSKTFAACLIAAGLLPVDEKKAAAKAAAPASPAPAQGAKDVEFVR
jgi:hypothetical protein